MFLPSPNLYKCKQVACSVVVVCFHPFFYTALSVFTQDWPNSYWNAVTYSVLPVILQSNQFDECTWRRMFQPLPNLYKCKQVACSVVVVCFYPFSLYCTLLLVVYFLISLFLYWCCCYIFCLCINYVNKPIIFVFWAFGYHFKNTISIFLAI